MNNSLEVLVKSLTAPTIVFNIDRDDIDLESVLAQEWREKIKQEAEVIINNVLLKHNLFSEFGKDFQVELDVDFEEGSIKVYIKHTAITLTLIIGISITGNTRITPETLATIHSPAVSKIETAVSRVTGTEAENETNEWSDPAEWKKHFESFDEALYEAPADATFSMEPALLMALKLTSNEDAKAENYEISWYLAEKEDTLEIIIQVKNFDDSNTEEYEGKIVIDLIEKNIESSRDLDRLSEAGSGILDELVGCALLQLAEWLSHKFSEPLDKREIDEVKSITDEIKNSRGKILQKTFLCVNILGLSVMGFK